MSTTKKKRLPGRPTVLERLGITKQDLKDAYRELENYHLVAERFGISRRTVASYLSRKDIPPKSKVARWYAEHPEAQSWKVREVSEASGLPKTAVERYYYDRRKQEINELREQLREELTEPLLVSTSGQKFPSRAVKRVVIHRFTWGEPVQVTMHMHGGGKLHYEAKFIPEL
jgi:transcriptional regulator with XRE-family HTH domain